MVWNVVLDLIAIKCKHLKILTLGPQTDVIKQTGGY